MLTFKHILVELFSQLPKEETNPNLLKVLPKYTNAINSQLEQVYNKWSRMREIVAFKFS